MKTWFCRASSPICAIASVSLERLAEIERCGLPDRSRQRLRHQRIQAFGTDRLQHRRDIARERGRYGGERNGGGGVAVGSCGAAVIACSIVPWARGAASVGGFIHEPAELALVGDP